MSAGRGTGSEQVSGTTQFCEQYLEMVDYKGGTAIHFANWANNIPHAKLLLINYPKSLDLSLLA